MRRIIAVMTNPLESVPTASLNARLASPESTVLLGAAIAQVLAPGDAVLLEGDLGAGKTALSRAILRALCADPALDVPSPTFTLVQNYTAPGFEVAHFDLWRLAGPDGLEELGWDDARSGVVLVEWPERLETLRPERALVVQLAFGAEEEMREVTLHGAPLPELPQELRMGAGA